MLVEDDGWDGCWDDNVGWQVEDNSGLASGGQSLGIGDEYDEEEGLDGSKPLEYEDSLSESKEREIGGESGKGSQ